ncbi:perosamine synthetase [Mycobacteroides abscessus subsp. abscessus]|nr:MULTISPECIES: DegT/DnrJ/EryC1/StrS family aminotransferase [Dermabacter]SHX49285.1 perosamine synthetase [Mycobacteroides abscessus subsp. abscessus]
MEPAQIEAAIIERMAAVQSVYLYGQPAAMEQICEIVKKRNLWVGEDAAQAQGGTLKGKQVGRFGRWGMFSLCPTKNMTAGEGGMAW